MKIDVFDTYAHANSGSVIHFDVLVPSGTAKDKALHFAEAFLTSIGLIHTQISSVRCQFCHSEMAHPRIRDAIEKHGHLILQMEGCPNPN